MTDELFPISAVSKESPKLVWIRRHGIKTNFDDSLELEEHPWSAWQGNLDYAIEADNFGTGETEEDAIVNWARRNEVRLWNEEGK